MDDNLRASVGTVTPEDDLRPAYQGAFDDREKKENDDWLRSMAGETGVAPDANADQAPAPDAPQQAAPVGSENDTPATTEAAAPWYAGSGDSDPLNDLMKAGAARFGSGSLAVGKDVARGATEAIPQAFGGFVDAIGEVDQFMQSVLPIGGMQLWDKDGNFDPSLISNADMKALEKADQTLFDMVAPKDADSVTGGIVRAGSQFLTGFLPAFGAMRAIGMGSFGASMGGGAIADMVVFDPNEKRLATFLNEVPALEGLVPDYLATTGEENQSEWEGRLKNAIEGAGLGLMSEGLLKAFKYYKAQRALAPAPEAEGAIAQAARDEKAAADASQISTEVSDDMLRPLGDASDNAPLVIEARPDETLTSSLDRVRAADDRMAQSVERGEAIENIKNIVEGKKRTSTPAAEPVGDMAANQSFKREAMDDALDELRSGAVSKAKMPARPVASIVRDLGGIDPASSLAGDLRSRGITAQSFPGLYKRGGAQSLDNIPGVEHNLFLEQGRVNADGYIDQQAFIDGLEAELKGDPWRTAEQRTQIDEIIAPAQELEMQLARLGIDYENMSNQAVKERLQQIVDEEATYRAYEESVVSRIDNGTSRTYAELYDEQREIWTVEQTAEARAAGVPEEIIQTKQPNKVYINMARIKGAEDVKSVIQAVADADAANIKTKTRGVVSNEQTIKESSKEFQDLNDLIGRAPGPMSAPQAVAARKVLASSAEQVTQLAKIASSPNAGKVDIYNFRRALSVHAAIQAEVIGARTETARALQSWAIPAGADRVRTDAVNELLANNMGGDLQKLAKMIGNISDESAINDIARQTVGMRTRDAVYSIYVNGLLSGPKTHLVNAMSNAAVSLYSLPERFLSEAFSNAFGKGDIARGETGAMAYGMVEGIRDGIRLMTLGPKAEGLSDLGVLWEQFGKTEMRANPISGAAFGLDPNSAMYKGLDFMGSLVGIPGTMLERGDLFFKSLNYRMELHALAFREASLSGAEGKAFADKLADTLRNPPRELHEQANKMAMVNTFTNPLGEMGRKVQGAISGTPLRWAMPFVRTPTNIMKYTFARTPLAYASSAIRADIAAGGARAAQAQSRIALGSMVMMTFAGLGIDGVISGGGPLDQKQRFAMEQNGWQPYSVKIGEKWYAYNRLDPLGMMVGMAADLADITNNPRGDASDDMVVMAGITAFAQNMASKTYARGAFELAAALDPRNPAGSPAQFLNRQLTSLIPFSSALRQSAQAMDPTMRESRDEVTNAEGKADALGSWLNKLINDTKRGIPGLSDTLPPMRDIFGEEMTRESGVGVAWDMIMPIQARGEKNDPILNAIIDNELKVDRPSRQINGINLSAEQYDQFQVLAGENLRRMLDPVVKSPGFKRMSTGPDGMQAQIILNTINAAREAARQQFTAQDPDFRDKRVNKMIKSNNLLLGN